MVEVIKKNKLSVFSFIGLVWLLTAFAGWLGGYKTAQPEDVPVVYTFIPYSDRTGWQPSGDFHVSGLLTIIEDCDRRALISEYIRSPGSAPQPMPWRDLEGRPRDESRGPSSAELNLSIQPPEFFYRAYLETVHVCPAETSEQAELQRAADGTVRFIEVRTPLYTIQGNVLAQNKNSASSSELRTSP